MSLRVQKIKSKKRNVKKEKRTQKKFSNHRNSRKRGGEFSPEQGTKLAGQKKLVRGGRKEKGERKTHAKQPFSHKPQEPHSLKDKCKKKAAECFLGQGKGTVKKKSGPNKREEKRSTGR